MVKKKKANFGCLCWPAMSQGKRQEISIEDTSQSTRQVTAVENPTMEPRVDQRPPSIPKEHDDFIEMLFPPGRHRSRTLTASLLSPKRRSEGGSIRWIRNRTNSLLSAKQSSIETDLDLFETVPATPDSFHRDFSATLPLGRWKHASEFEPRRRADIWPEYIWRLNQKRVHHRFSCTGCEDTCTRVYKHPIEHSLGSYFDNESYYNTHDVLRKNTVSGDGSLPRRPSGYDQPRFKHTFGIEAKFYDVPSPSNRSVFNGRSSLKERLGERSNSAVEFQTRPRAGSLDQRAVHTTEECALETERISDVSMCNWNQVHHHYDRPNLQYPVKPPITKHRSGMSNNFDFECHPSDQFYLRPGRSLNRYDGDSGYIQSDKGVLTQMVCGAVAPTRSSHGLYPDLNCVIPSGLVIEKQHRILCRDNETSLEDGDYLMPLMSMANRFQSSGKMQKSVKDHSGRYLAMNNASVLKERVDTGAKSSTRHEPEVINTPKSGDNDVDDEQRETRDRQESALKEDSLSTTSCSGTHEKKEETVGKSKPPPNAMENGTAEGENTDPEESSESQSIALDPDDHNKSAEPENNCEPDDGYIKTEILRDSRLTPDSTESNAESERGAVSVRPKETNPPLALRCRSQLDLLLMSPPPQCSFMVDNSYVNVSDPDTKDQNIPTPVDVVVSDKELHHQQWTEMRNNQATAQMRAWSVEEPGEERSSSKNTIPYKYFPSWEEGVQPSAKFVMLCKKVATGNDYCHTYLPTLRENIMNACM